MEPRLSVGVLEDLSAELVGLKFQPLLADEIRGRGVLNVKTPKHLTDPRLGLPNLENACSTCGAKRRDEFNKTCPGHSGYIILPQPVFHPLRVKALAAVLQKMCLQCCRLLPRKGHQKSVLEGENPPEDVESPPQYEEYIEPVAMTSSNADNSPRVEQDVPGAAYSANSVRRDRALFSDVDDVEGRHPAKKLKFSTAHKQLEALRPDKTYRSPSVEVTDEIRREEHADIASEHQSNEMDAVEVDDDLSCKYCRVGSKKNPNRYPKLGLKVVKKKLEKVTISILQMQIDPSVTSVPEDFWGRFGSLSERSRTLMPDEVLDILCSEKAIESLRKAGIDIVPAQYIISVVYVPPNCVRLAETYGLTKVQDCQTAVLKALLKLVKNLTFGADGTQLTRINDENVESLQGAVTLCYRSNLFVDTEKSINAQQLVFCSGLTNMRKNFAAKVCSYSARGVMRGDPFINVNEIGIPIEIASQLSVPEIVTNFNIQFLHSFAKKREVVEIIRAGYSLDLSKGRQGLEIGDVVHRCLKDGDLVFINRPPTFHKHALIALKVKIYRETKFMNHSTFGINPLICTPLFGDFDGDCVHVFIPQSKEVIAELSELMTMPNQLVSSQGGQAIASLIQDSLLGAYLITYLDIFLSKESMNQLQMWCPSSIPIPAIFKSPKGPRFTGKQLFSMMLPQGINYKSPDGRVLIRDSELLEVDSRASPGWLQKSVDSLLCNICSSVDSETAVQYLNNSQAAVNEWLTEHGFSVGLLDFHFTGDTLSRKKLDEEVLCALESARLFSLALQGYSDMDMHLVTVCSSRKCKLTKSLPFPFQIGKHPSDVAKYAALQEVTISGFQSKFSDLEKTVMNHARRNNSLLHMVRSGSKGSISKTVSQSACLGLQLYKGKEFHYDRSKTDYKRALLQEKAGHLDSLELWKAKGLVSNSYYYGLDPEEFFLHSIASRNPNASVRQCNGLNRNLLCFLKDLRLEYDGTVRGLHDHRIFQFSYYNEEKDEDESVVTEESRDSVLSKPEKSRNFLEPGDPVGAIAATALIAPTYDLVMTGSGIIPLQILRDTLEPRPAMKSSTLKPMDQVVLLRLSKAACKPPSTRAEWIALHVQEHLKPISLEMLATEIRIEYEPVNEAKSSRRWMPWIGCIELHKEALQRCNLTLEQIILRLRELSPEFDDNIVQGLHFYARNSFAPVICFFPLLSSSHLDYLDTMKDRMFRPLLGMVIKGYNTIESVNIKWEDECYSSTDGGELVVEVVVKAARTKRGDPWKIVQSACVPIMHLIDWRRSNPSSPQEIYQALGIEASYQFILENLIRVRSMNKIAIDRKHLMLVADCACHVGEVSGFCSAGYREYLSKLCIDSPISLSTSQAPRQIFEDAAVRNVTDELRGITEAASCGKRVSIGTGSSFSLLWKDSENLDCCGEFDTLLHSKKSTEPVAVNVEKTWKEIEKLHKLLQKILHCSFVEADGRLKRDDERVIIEDVLPYHPDKDRKIGSGIKRIKIAYHPVYQCRCFYIVRKDGSEIDFSFRKCLENMASKDSVLLRRYQEKMNRT